MKDCFTVILKFAGTMFMGISTFLFYNHLLSAYFNPGFSVVVYFNYYAEGLFEIVLFLLLIPFIIFALLHSYLDVRYALEKYKYSEKVSEILANLEKGILSTKEKMYTLDSIETVEIEQSWMGRLFNREQLEFD